MIRNKKKCLKIWISFLLAVFLMAGCGSAAADTGSHNSTVSEKVADGTSQMSVHYIDVGQGDATLILCDGDAMLIDAGNNNKGTAVQSYLQNQGVESLDYVIGTHPDSDHIGGLDVVITKFDCKTIFLTDASKDTKTYQEVLDAMDYRGYKKTVPIAGDSYKLGSASFTITGPLREDENANDNSIALVLQHGDNRFYLEGDAEEQEEADILEAGYDVSARVYKVGHHGSKTSTTDAMLEAVSPDYAVISVGEDNSYGHPSAETINKLRAAGVEMYRTDQQGSIITYSDGKDITFSCAPDETNLAGEPKGVQVENEVTEEALLPAGISAENNPVSDSYVLNSDSKKFHKPDCSYLPDNNREDTVKTREELITEGYEPCKRCSP